MKKILYIPLLLFFLGCKSQKYIYYDLSKTVIPVSYGDETPDTLIDFGSCRALFYKPIVDSCWLKASLNESYPDLAYGTDIMMNHPFLLSDSGVKRIKMDIIKCLNRDK